jgi:hypothetical protein
MLGAFARREGYAFRNVEAAGCPPVTHDIGKIVNANKLQDCEESAKLVASRLNQYDAIWIAADWRTYDRKSPDFMPAFEKTVRDLVHDGRRVVLIGKGPVIKGYDRSCRQKTVLMPLLKCEYPDVALSQDVVTVNADLAAIADRTPGVYYFDANGWLCPRGSCPMEDESGKLIYFDSSHLSLDASWRLGERIARSGVPAPFTKAAQDRLR